MGKPKSPTPPDPVQTASGATSTNVSTAIANAFLQNANQYGPAGNTTYDVTGSYDWTDPYTHQTLSIPTFSANTTLSPIGQEAFNLGQQANRNLAQLAQQQSAYLNPYLSTGIDLSNDAIAGRGIAPFNLDTSGVGADTSRDAIMRQLGQQPFAYSNLPDPGRLQLGNEATEARLFDLGSARLDPMFTRQENSLRQRLADQGIQVGSDAFTNAMTDFGQTKNDAYNQLLLTGRQQAANETAAEYGADVARRQMFAGEQLGQRQQNMAERASAFGELSGGTGLDLALQQQRANEQLAGYSTNLGARQQSLNELLTQRNQPLNEISALLSGSQIAQPGYNPFVPGSIPTTDVAGIINQSYLNSLGLYNAQNGNSQSTMGGLFGLGSAGLGALGMSGALGSLFGGGAAAAGGSSAVAGLAGLAAFSDRRLKERIRRIGTADNGLPIYAFNYRGSNMTQIGFMADDVERLHPEAVTADEDGYKMVRYDLAVL